MSNRLKIALGDLRHKTTGRHSVFMPIGIGSVASYTLSKIGKEKVEIRMYDNAETILKDIDGWNPDVIGLSNYCWNTELSQLVFNYSKKKNSSTICISGGPDFPTDDLECEDYLIKRPDIDFYIYFDGEIAFAELIKKICKGKTVKFLKSNFQNGAMSIHPFTKKLVKGKLLSRPVNLDVISSPYLSGLMDQWFNGYYAPSLETYRGCPFTCAYCRVGQAIDKGLAAFSEERVKNDLTYMAKKMQKYPSILLSICDSNFGMYPRDEEIAKHCRSLQDKFGWPNVFDVTTGKANYDRILRIASMLKNKMPLTCSMQSLNQETLKIIGRKNVPMDEYGRIQSEIKKRGMLSSAELIVPMPEETKKSFFEGVKKLIEAGVEMIVPYTTMLLLGTFLASKQCRQKYHLQSKFRIIPRQFGEYRGVKCFEIEEVCVATSTMTFANYLEVRGFALILSFFSGEQFDIVRRHIEEIGISYYDFSFNLWKLIKSGKTALSATYYEFLDETQKELWGSKKEIYDFFSKQENYAKLLKGDIGDNLIRKYNLKLLIECCVPSIELAYESILKMKIAGDSEIADSLNAAKKWLITTRNLNNIFKGDYHKNINKELKLKYDVESWYQDNHGPLTGYKRNVLYRIFYNVKELDKVLKQEGKLYGEDLSFKFSKMVLYRGSKYFWCHVEKIV
jgi:radical SAM superfamily enzyme YgiQ (UPF0313 family)